jgi:hypothetical protein
VEPGCNAAGRGPSSCFGIKKCNWLGVDMLEGQKPEPLMVCPTCKVEMRLFGIEADVPNRDLFTFECNECGLVEAQSAAVR